MFSTPQIYNRFSIQEQQLLRRSQCYSPDLSPIKLHYTNGESARLNLTTNTDKDIDTEHSISASSSSSTLIGCNDETVINKRLSSNLQSNGVIKNRWSDIQFRKSKYKEYLDLCQINNVEPEISNEAEEKEFKTPSTNIRITRSNVKANIFDKKNIKKDKKQLQSTLNEDITSLNDLSSAFVTASNFPSIMSHSSLTDAQYITTRNHYNSTNLTTTLNNNNNNISDRTLRPRKNISYKDMMLGKR